MYDDEGKKTWSAELDIYGRVRTFDGRSLKDCPFRFQGQYEDAETGLYYNRFRYYDPDSGSYLSQDPIGLAGGNPTIYGYVRDVNSWVDRFGLSSAYEVDTYDNLKAQDVVGDKLGTHHVSQKALAKTQVIGYPQTTLAGDAPAIRLPDAEHATITKLQSQNKMKKTIIGITAAVAWMTVFMLLSSCTGNMKHIRNKKEGQLTAKYQLVATGKKSVYLDDETASRPPYIQMINDSILTFLNPHNNSIYFYNYDDESFMRKITYEKEGPDAVYYPSGYYIKNMDSIYIYLKSLIAVALTDSSGRVKERIPLKNDAPYWPQYFPQYLLSTTIPIVETQGQLILTGLSPFSIRDSLIGKFKFSACIELKTYDVKFFHTYPEAIYGNNSNWEGGLSTLVYPALSPSGELIYSFPASHDLYITKWDSEIYKTVYAGSNVAGTIHSVNWDNPPQTPSELLYTYFAEEDVYTALLHDPWRKIYYRFMLKGIPNATSATGKEQKPIIVIVMDEQFNYLGETVIGTGEEWNWTNSFVTHEGLNIEYIDEKDENEDYLIFKIFKPEEL